MAKLVDLDGLAYFYSKIKAMLADKLGKNDTAVNASKVNNLTVETSVPKNAKFTDTVYTHPSTHPASMITGLASVATSGSYNDLTDKPTIPAASTVDSELSSTSTNPVQNKVIKEALDGKLGKNEAAARANKLNTNGGSATQPIYFANGVPVATTYTLGKSVPSDAKFTDTVYNHPTTHPASMITGLSTVATSGSYSDLSNKPTIPVVPTNVSAFINDAGYLTQHQSLDGYVKSVNGVTPNVAGDVTIAVGGGVSTDTTNTWTVKQTFSDIDVEFEYYKTEFQGSSSATPTESVLFCQTLGNFTLNLSNIVSKIPNGRSTVFSAYLSCFSDGVLTITNAGTLYYVGNASDLALTGTGLLVNILIIKNTSGAVDSVVQSSKLS